MLVLNVLVKPVWIFFIDKEIQNKIGHEAYGNYFATLSLSYVLLFIADAGLSNMMNQKLANNQALNTRQYLKIKLWLSVVYVFLCCLVAWLTRFDEWSILFYVIIIQVFTSFLVFLRSIITAHQYFSTDAWFSIIDKTLVILLCAGFIYYPLVFGSIDLLLFLKIQTFCTVTATVIVFFFIIKKRLITHGVKANTNEIIKSLAPFAAIILLMSVHYRIDGFLLKSINTNGAYQAGIYASGYRLLDATNMMGYLAASFLVPFIARHQLQKDLIKEAVLNIDQLLIFFGIGVACFSFLFAPWLQQLLYHTNNAYNSRIIQLCVAVLPAYLLVHIYGSVLTATSKFRSFIFILLIAVIINVVFNFFLIPSMGALGCCISALISQYFCAAACYVLASKKLGMPFMLRSKILYLAITAGLSLFFYFAKIAMLNVWFILSISVCCMLLLIITQVTHVKRFFIQLH